jgi:hypothetical protein
MIEIAPAEYCKKLNYYEAIMYCFSLNIDGKIGWRLPNSVEYELTEKTGWSVDDLHFFTDTFKLRVQFLTTPVRDIT